MPERGAEPNVPRIQRKVLDAVRALTSPLLPDDYLEMINPLWSTRELRGRIESIDAETRNAATVLIKPGYRWDGHKPGQYLRIGLDIVGEALATGARTRSPPTPSARTAASASP
jgi:hypothetical protein